jgi:hypothetical protein
VLTPFTGIEPATPNRPTAADVETQEPFTQLPKGGVHDRPQPPQLFASVSGSEHAPAQQLLPVLHAGNPQPPQFAAAMFMVSAQTPEQHARSPVQRLSQAPQ